MRVPLHGDVVAAAVYLLGEVAGERDQALCCLMAEAERASCWTRRTGRAHPDLGDGSLMAAVLAKRPLSEPSLADRDYCSCLAMVYAKLGEKPPSGL